MIGDRLRCCRDIYFAGLMPVLVLNHIDVALEAMVTKMNDFAGKPKSEAGKPFVYLRNSIGETVQMCKM